MKYYPRLNQYKASNVTFCPDTQKAYSYNWWTFVKPINGKLVFNNYRYSTTTAKHQFKVRCLLDSMGEKPVFVRTPKSLDDSSALLVAIELAEREIESLQDKINTKGTRKSTNAERMIRIGELQKQIKQIRKLIK